MEKVLLSDLGQVAKEALIRVPPQGECAALIALQGDLGAGKTTFVQTVGKELGIEETMQSPTYVLMKSYPIHFSRFTKLVHIDAYRLTKPEEFKTLLPEQFLSDPHALVLLEWPERVEGELPTPDLVITFSSEGASTDERFIEISNI